MVTFFQRRTSAVAEALLLAILVATFAAVTTLDTTTMAAARERADRAAEPNYGLLLAAAIGQPAVGQSPNGSGAEKGRRTVEGILSFAHGDDFARGRQGHNAYFVTDGHEGPGFQDPREAYVPALKSG
jgi:hypothetical protein